MFLPVFGRVIFHLIRSMQSQRNLRFNTQYLAPNMLFKVILVQLFWKSLAS